MSLEKTYGDWFSGFGGCAIGAKEAGFKLVFAFEHDPDIAAVYADNLGNHVTVGDILLSDSGIYHDKYPRTKNRKKRRRQDITGDWWTRLVDRGVKHTEFKFNDPQFPSVTTKHDSPPCPNFSIANKNRYEGLREMALARKCCEYLMYARPDFYTLENVYGYRHSESFNTILDTLTALGYGWNYWHINMADYGVPQSRKRLILVARKDGKKPVKPMQTHYNPNGKKAESGFVGSLFWKPWNGWYEAIEDLIPDLPDSEFAPWQLNRLPEELQNLYLSKDKGDYSDGHAREGEPAVTVTANDIGRRRAFVVDGKLQPEKDNKRELQIKDGDETIVPIVSSPSYLKDTRAFILANGSFEGKIPIASEDGPAGTVTANENQGSLKAFVVDNGNSKAGMIKQSDEPMGTVRILKSGGAMSRAFIIDRLNASSNTIRNGNEPSLTVTTYDTKHQSPNGYMGGRVVQMTPRCLARFQTFPDSYCLPASKLWFEMTRERVVSFEDETSENVDKKLACRGIGNACPPLFMKILYREL